MVSDNIYGMRVEMLAIGCLTVIVIMGMILKQNEIAAAAVGGIAGFISQKGLTDRSSAKGDAGNPPAAQNNNVPEGATEEDPDMA